MHHHHRNLCPCQIVVLGNPITFLLPAIFPANRHFICLFNTFVFLPYSLIPDPSGHIGEYPTGFGINFPFIHNRRVGRCLIGGIFAFSSSPFKFIFPPHPSADPQKKLWKYQFPQSQPEGINLLLKTKHRHFVTIFAQLPYGHVPYVIVVSIKMFSFEVEFAFQIWNPIQMKA